MSKKFTAVALNQRVVLEQFERSCRWQKLKSSPFSRLFRSEDGELFYIFDFGACVQLDSENISGTIIRNLEKLGYKCLLETLETYEVLVDSERNGTLPPRVRVAWDKVIVPDSRPDTFEVVALLLGQSAALERYELEADELLQDAFELAKQLSVTGRMLRPNRRLFSEIGRIMSRRLELARWFFLLDRPDSTWEDPLLSRLYDALFDNLELTERYRAMLHKLSATETTISNLVELWEGTNSLRLEWAIVILIVIEVLMMFWEIFKMN